MKIKVSINKEENIFSILSQVREEMIHNRCIMEMNEMTDKILQCKNPKTALDIINEYVEINYV